MLKTTTAHANLIAQLDLAGYTTDAGDVYHCVLETPTKFVFIMQPYDSVEGHYLVGAFYKATVSRPADYRGCPAYEGDSYEDAMKALTYLLA